MCVKMSERVTLETAQNGNSNCKYMVANEIGGKGAFSKSTNGMN